MIETDRSKSRKERTFVGGYCAACELSLEHKLSGEKVLQFSCGHVVHEACLYEYISGEAEEDQTCPECDAPLELDISRGGNILDLNRLTSMVRTVAQGPGDTSPPQGSPNPNNNADAFTTRDEEPSSRYSYSTTGDSTFEDVDGHMSRIQNLAGSSIQARHRNESATSGRPDDASVGSRKHDYDLQQMESQIRHMDSTKNIPRPQVTIRSEFPTLTRSKQPQSVTCLVTVEVPATRTRVRQIGGQHPLSTLPMLTNESPRALEAIAVDLKERMDSWHGLEPDKFGPLRLHANVKVGRDGTTWQKLDCFLFSELLICVREKKATSGSRTSNGKPKFQLKGSVLIRKHLNNVESSGDDLILTLNLSVASLPVFRLKFANREQLDTWKLALVRLDVVAPDLYGPQDEQDTSGTEEEEEDFDYSRPSSERPSSISSSTGTKTGTTAATDYADLVHNAEGLPPVMHVPIDIVVVVPMSSSMQGLKIKLVKDALRFLLTNLGERDRMGLVTYGSGAGAMPLVGMATKDWDGWREVGRSIKPVGQRSLRADPIEGANVALDLLSQRRVSNLVTSVLLISDSQASDSDCMDLVVRRAHESKISIYSFGLGQTHKADTLIELSTRTNAAYVYVKEWNMLRECVAGCLGSLQSQAHLGAKLRLKIPEGSVAKFVRISGALHTTTRRSTGREAEATLGGLRFGDKRDILVQLVVEPDSSTDGDGPQDHWESIVTGLATLGGSLDDHEPRPQSVEEVPLLQADLTFGDLEKGGAMAHLSQPTLLTITMLPVNPRAKRGSRGSIVPPVPSHPSIVQRRMEMLTSDMLGRALGLVAKGQSDNAHRLLTETRTILQGLGKGSLPPLPPLPPKAGKSATQRSSSAPRASRTASPGPAGQELGTSPKAPASASGRGSPHVPQVRRGSNQSLPPHFSQDPPRAAASIDPRILHALDADIEACMEHMSQPTVFSHDARKAALQTIGVISSQRAYTFRTETESIWAGRIRGIKKMGEVTKEWQMVGNDTLTEEL